MVVREVDEVLSLEQALVENLHREDLNPLEEAAAYQQLIEDFGLTQEQVAQRVGESRSAVANTLRLFQLPPAIQRLVAENQLSAGHAKALLGTPDRAFQEALAKRIVAEGLSVREVEEAVRGAQRGGRGGRRRPIGRPRPRRRAAVRRLRAPGLLELEELLADHLDTRVSGLDGRERRRGKVVVEFAALEDLERIYRAMTEARPTADRSPSCQQTLDVESRVSGLQREVDVVHNLCGTLVENVGEGQARTSLELLEQLALALGADDALGRLAVLEDDERRDAHDVEAAGDVGVVVDVELGDLELAGLLGRRSRRGSGRSSCTGPHHSAQKSTRTGSAEPAISSSKVASVRVVGIGVLFGRVVVRW